MGRVERSALNTQEEILAVWRGWVERASNEERATTLFRDAANGFNTVLAAESMLIFLLPVGSDLPLFSLPKNTEAGDTSTAAILNRLFLKDGSTSMPDVFPEATDRIVDLFESYYEQTGRSFAGGGYLLKDEGDPAGPKDDEVVDSFSTAASVSIRILKLLADWRHSGGGEARKREAKWAALEARAHTRLMQAMIGLHDSFAVTTIGVRNWDAACQPYAWSEVKDKLNTVRVRLNALRRPDQAIDVDDAFECGWSWSRVSEDDRLLGDIFKGRDEPAETSPFDAQTAPYLYFTANALDGIADLWSPSVQSAGILNPEELALAARLRALWHATTDYWSEVAAQVSTLGGAGPTTRLQDLPWTTVDGDESDYYTLYLLGILLLRSENPPISVAELTAMLEELAQRARVTRRPSPSDTDPAIALHYPGKIFRLKGQSGDEVFQWRAYDIAPLLLKYSGILLERAEDQETRVRLRQLAQEIWNQLERRRISDDRGREQLDAWHRNAVAAWDDVASAFPGLLQGEYGPELSVRLDTMRELGIGSWYFTERTMEALVRFATAERHQAPPAPGLSGVCVELITELETVLADRPRGDAELQERLLSAREQIDRSPSGALNEALAVMSSLYEGT
jgi:hypothetical protein